jgi:hypothetical protein
MESDRQRWLEAVSPPISDNPDETVYEEWDCPQVTAIHPYVARQPDELSLEVADVVNVLRKITDGKITNKLFYKLLDICILLYACQSSSDFTIYGKSV